MLCNCYVKLCVISICMVGNIIWFHNLSERKHVNIKQKRPKNWPLGNTTCNFFSLRWIVGWSVQYAFTHRYNHMSNWSLDCSINKIHSVAHINGYLHCFEIIMTLFFLQQSFNKRNFFLSNQWRIDPVKAAVVVMLWDWYSTESRVLAYEWDIQV